MILYLSSYRLGNKSQTLIDSVGGNKKVAVIANAMDFLSDKNERDESTRREIEDLKQFGFEPEEVDLTDYFGEPKELDKK